MGWLRLLALYDLVFVILCTLVFPRWWTNDPVRVAARDRWSGAGRVITLGRAAGRSPGSTCWRWGYTPVEARQGLAQKIFYLHVPAGVERAARLLAGGDRQRALPLAARSPARPLRRGLGRGGARLQRGHAHHRSDLGQADLGHLVDLGRRASPSRSSCSSSSSAIWRSARDARSGGARPGSAPWWDPRHAAGAVHSPERLSLPHAAPAAGGAQAERAVAAAGDAADPADRVWSVSSCCTSDWS